MAHAKPFANQAYFLAVGQDNDVAAGLARPGRIDGPLYQRYPGQLLDQLVRNDGIFLDGRNDNAAFFHFLSRSFFITSLVDSTI